VRTSTSLACVALGITLGLAMAATGPSLARFSAGLMGQGGRTSEPHAARMAATPQGSWLATWAASPQAAGGEAVPRGGFDYRTVRDVIYTSVGGTAIRVRISNLYGTLALHIGAASVGRILDGAGLLPAGTTALAFGERGERSVTIPAGGSVTSDPVSYDVPPLTELAVSLYLSASAGPMTGHSLAQQDSYVAVGDHADTSRAAPYDITEHSWYFLTEVDVRSMTADGTIVAFGDSITDGTGSHAGSNDRWPNYLARRLEAAYGERAPGVVDAGISGNRVLTTSACGGRSALQRFGRDALGVAGVRAVILLEGINDINFASRPPGRCTTPASRDVTAGEIEGGYRRLIAMAHARGVAVYLGTLTPAAGALTPARVAMREAVNRWILASSAAHISDGVINFAGAVADPGDPAYLNPPCNSGDDLHPDDLGYNMMADAIPLAWARSGA
jgi:lysophospholipase L1-like esterase